MTAYALLGYTRSGIGVDATVRSRYIYFGVVLTVPALAAGLEVLGRALSRRRVLVAVVAWLTTAAVVVGVGVAQAERWTVSRLSLISDNQHRIVAAGRLVASGAPLLRTQPMPDRNPDVTVAALGVPSVQAALPDVRPGRRAELYVAAHLQVDLSAVARSFTPPHNLRWHRFEEPNQTSADSSVPAVCETRTTPAGGVIEVAPIGAPTEFRLIVSGREVRTQLASRGVRSPMVRWAAQPGAPVYVASTAAGATLRVIVPAGAVTLCAN
jgi:hypothetical protein